jgi:sugar lactone lactonase YvrE
MLKSPMPAARRFVSVFAFSAFSVLLSAPALCQAQTYTITTVAGGGFVTQSGNSVLVGDGGPATAAYMLPNGVAVDSVGNIYIADAANNLIRKITPDGMISSIAGDAVNQTSGGSGDGGPATNALLNKPQSVTVDSAGNLYISDNFRIRKISSDGIISAFAGGGSGFTTNYGDGGPATQAIMQNPEGLAVDSAGNLYIVDTGLGLVRKVSAADGTISTVAGCYPGACITLGDDGPATKAMLLMPYAVAVDSNGVLYIADTLHSRIREVTTDGTIKTLAGSDGGLMLPKGVAVDPAGNVYIGDSFNYRIEMVPPGGAINTIAGTGAQGSTGDGGPAASAMLASPQAMAVGPSGSLYFVDNQMVIRLLTPSAQ